MVCGQHVPVDASAPAVQLRAFPSESQATWRRDAHSAPGAAGDLKILKLEIGTESPENSRCGF